MPFKKGDANINRKGRPKNAEIELLREALDAEGKKRGVDFWSKVADYAFRDKNVMIAIIKKFIGDKSDPAMGRELASQIVYVINNGNTKRCEGNRVNLLPASKPAENKA